MAESPHGERAKEQFQKLSFYRISLAFAVLGLATQTASFGAFIIADVAELLAWLSLLVSGMVALGRIDVSVHQDLLLGEIERGTTEAIDDLMRQQTYGLMERGQRMYDIHRRCFVGGFALLAFARGVSPIVGIYERMF